ncbi:MAG: GH36 C-terminal domain-containing protein, partial [Eubacterium sp.]|nr:GH36 C-terminal domain-containing protein [Eubacterium sp.]
LNSEKTEGVLFIAAVNTRCIKEAETLYFDGLEKDRIYEFDLDGRHFEKSGAYLMSEGIPVDAKQQFYNRIIEIKAK